MFNEYPHTDLHELNLDWIIKKVKELAAAWAQVQQDWTDEQAAFANLQSWIENYFNNLDVQTEINVKLDSMVVAGTMSELIAPYVASGLPAEVADQIGDVVAAQIGPVVAAQISAVVADQLPAVAAAAAAQEVSAWLALHVNPDTGYVIDDTFTVHGAAADAKAVGDEFTAIKSALTELEDVVDDMGDDVSDLQSSVSTLSTHKVAQPLDDYNQPTDGTQGQSLRTNGDGTTEWADVGLPTDEQTEEAISKWLEEHPEATTTVEDGSITEAKFTNALKLATIKDYVTPEMFGAKGDGTTDDTIAITNCISYANENAKNVVFPSRNGYVLYDTITIQNINLVMYSPIIYKGMGSAIIINGCIDKTLEFNVVYGTKNPSDEVLSNTIGIELVNAQRCMITIPNVKNFETGVLLNLVVDCQFYLGFIYSCKNSIKIAPYDTGYCNNNVFIGGKLGRPNTFTESVIGILIAPLNSYNPNNNYFIGTNVEYCELGIDVVKGRYNTFENIRTENCTSAYYLDTDAVGNYLKIGFGVYTGTDNGFNKIMTPNSNIFNDYSLLYNTGKLQNICADDGSKICGENLYGLSSGKPSPFNMKGVCVSNGVQMSSGSSIGIYCSCYERQKFLVKRQYSANNSRIIVAFFDEDNVNIIAEPITFAPFGIMQASTFQGTNVYITSVNAVGEYAFIIPANAKNVYIGIYTTGSQTGVILQGFSVYTNGNSNLNKRRTVLNAKPTNSFANMGLEVVNSNFNGSGVYKWYWDGTSFIDVSI